MDVEFNSTKPLGHKSYGSIPHLPGSRLGPGDYHIHDGQARIATEKVRDKHDRVIVQEKLDGSNVAVAKINGNIVALTRAGYLATTSPYVQHHYFAQWTELNKGRFDAILTEGERMCGEWLAQAHGTVYNLFHEPFVAFDIIQGKERVVHEELVHRANEEGFITPQVLSYLPVSIYDVMQFLTDGSFHGGTGVAEGAVWRVERKGKVDFLCKFVQHSKVDGIYLPEMNGTGQPIWNVDIIKLTGEELQIKKNDKEK